jgi:hypothetical protein
VPDWGEGAPDEGIKVAKVGRFDVDIV